MALQVPARVRDLDPAWLTAMFEESGVPGAAVADVELAPVGVGVGFAGRMVRLQLGYEGDPGERPPSLIAKLPTPAEAMLRFMIESRGYEVEGRFYAELADQVPVATPRSYWSGADIEADAFCLLLEDLTDYEPGEQLASEVDPEVISELVRHAARTHRQFWNSEALASLDWMAGPAGREVRAFRAIALAGAEAWRDEFAVAHSPRFAEGAVEGVQRLPELAVRAADGASTLVHGDYRLGNAMFSTAAGKPPTVILDWQLTRYGSGAYDVAYLIGQSVPTEQRRQHEERWLAEYRDELGQPAYTEARFRDDFAIGILQSMLVPLMNGTVLAESRRQAAALPDGGTKQAFETSIVAGTTLTATWTARAAAAIEDHDAFRVLG